MSDKSYKPQQLSAMVDICISEFATATNGILLTASVSDGLGGRLSPTGQEPVVSGSRNVKLIHLSKVGNVDFDREMFAEIYGEEKLEIVDRLNGIAENICKKQRVSDITVDSPRPMVVPNSGGVVNVPRSLKDRLWDLKHKVYNHKGALSRQMVVNELDTILREL